MDDFKTIAIFNSSLDYEFTLAKNILEENGIEYYATNENFRFIEPPWAMLPENMCIELRVPIVKSELAMRLLDELSKN
ncbi:MAG TPA: hypothetical protein PKI17_00860 [Syntrophomonas sp.]|nr:hypothetical protein [Syntrophomonas sp.]